MQARYQLNQKVGKSTAGLASDPPTCAETKESADQIFLLSLNQGIMQVRQNKRCGDEGKTSCAPFLLAARSRVN